MKILICFGTRPEWLKIKPLLSLLNRDEYKLLFTGQHEDLIKNIDFDFISKINISNNRLDDVISSCLLNFPNENFDYVLVQGDTASAFGCAIASYNRKIKIVHLEAGLRSYDLNNPYPEESYRQMISRISDYNLCPTSLSYKNLEEEKVSGKNYIVGNTILDNLIEYKNKIKYTNKVLVTLHRRENHEIILDWFNQLNLIANKFYDIEFILPIHPNPNVSKYKHLLDKRIKVVDPLTHENLIELLSECKFVISDSGGIQEESSFLNKKVIVCRTTTERPEGIDTGHLYICESPQKLESLVYKINENYYINEKCPYGDGYSSEKIIKLLKNGNSNT
jgi:UDP-N-acetylglucosamine 2-epimerase (non-hydrolysing)